MCFCIDLLNKRYKNSNKSENVNFLLRRLGQYVLFVHIDLCILHESRVNTKIVIVMISKFLFFSTGFCALCIKTDVILCSKQINPGVQPGFSILLVLAIVRK